MSVEKIKFMLMASDMNRAVAFYKNALGLDLSFQTPGWTEMKFGDAIVALHGGWTGGVNKTGLSFQVEHINDACAKAKSLGAKIIHAPEDRGDEPIYLATIEDTEGNQVMISQIKKKAA